MLALTWRSKTQTQIKGAAPTTALASQNFQADPAKRLVLALWFCNFVLCSGDVGVGCRHDSPV